jgi:diguanylate cyclase (GGDEF)-like protein/PAS domain S-box-containing protein
MSKNETPEILNETGWLYACLDDMKDAVILTDNHSNIIYANRAYCDFTEYSLNEILGQNPGMMRSGYHDKDFYKNIWDVVKTNDRWDGEIWNRSKSGRLYPLHLTIKKIIGNDQKTYYLGILVDIKYSKLGVLNNLNLFKYDFLTKIPNKLYLHASFNKIMNAFERDRHNYAAEEINNKVAIFYVNLNLNPINEQYGFVVGDQILQEAAKRLHSILRNSDVVGRFSGNSFVMIVSQIHIDATIKVFMHSIQTVLSSPFAINGFNINLNYKIGSSCLPEDGMEFEELVKAAKDQIK